MFNLEKAIQAWRGRMVDRHVSDLSDIEEMEGHLRDVIEEHVDGGMTAENAFRTAIRKFGDEESIRREFVVSEGVRHYVAQSLLAPMLVSNYLKTSFRNMSRHKGYAFINIAGLAIGIACCILIGLYIQDELSYDQYPAAADRSYRLILEVGTNEGQAIETARTPPPWASVLAEELPEVESYVRFRTPDVSWLVTYEPTGKEFQERYFYFSDPTVLDFFTFPLIQGDPATALVEPNTIVISESAARKYFGNEDPMGKVLHADNSYDFRITGVMKDVPRNSHFTVDFLPSNATINANESPGMYSGPGFDYFSMRQNGISTELYTYLRLSPGISAEDVEAKLPSFIEKHLGERLRQNNTIYHASLQPLTSIHLYSDLQGELRANSDINYIYIFSAVGVFIILIACMNFMNLATARSASRAQEVGLRKAIGAQRTHLMSQFLGETLVMVFIALLLSILMVQALLPIFNDLSGKPLALTISTGWILGGIAMVFIIGIIAGSYPAFILSSFEPARVLKGSEQSLSSNARLRKVLVIVQFAISIIFIIGTGIVARQMQYIQNKKLGFDKDHVVVLQMSDRDMRFRYVPLKDELMKSADIIAVAGSESIPGGLINQMPIRPEGAPPEQGILVDSMIGDHDLINALGAELIQGRNFSMTFPTDSMEAVIFNESAVKLMGWQDDPLDKEIVVFQNWKHAKVVGVVEDFHHKSLHQPIEPLFLHITPSYELFIIRTRTLQHLGCRTCDFDH